MSHVGKKGFVHTPLGAITALSSDSPSRPSCYFATFAVQSLSQIESRAPATCF